MGKVWCSTFMTLDGVVESPERWMPAVASDESNALVAHDVESADRMLLGRVTYQELSSFWPAQPDAVPLAAITNNAAKTVVSNTLSEASWGPDTRLVPDAAVAVRELRRSGDAVVVTGSPSVVQSLLAEGLLDEVRLIVVPTVRGAGMRLFDERSAADLELVECLQLPKGAVRLVYRTAGVHSSASLPAG